MNEIVEKMEDHPEPSSSTLDVLESGSYLNPSSTSEIKNTLVKFSNSLNGTGRISLLTAGKEDCEEFISLLLTLKKNIKETLSELGRSRRKQVENYSCGECTQQIPIEIGNDFWSAFQSHEHLEELYVKFLSGIPIIEEEKVIQNEPTQSNFGDLGNTENIDSGIEHEVPANEDDHKSASGSEEEGGLNTFRFNFKLQYDPTVEAKLYPESILKAVRRIDKVPDFTIQRAGIIRGVCLLCSCDLISKSRISKNSILDHVMGQRHLKFSTNSTYLDALKAYHETFVNLEPEFQAHQVYFRPETHKSSKCILCNCMVRHFLMMDHIRLNQHKRMVLDMFKKKSTVYYLMDFQALAYGVTEDQNDGKQEENAEEKVAVKPKTPAKENTPVKSREKKDKDSIVSTDEPQHHIVKSIEDPISTNISAWVPHRYRDHMQFLKEKGNIILCEPCQVKLIRDAEVLKKHLKQSSHQKFCTKLVKYSFFCEICNAKFTDENTWSKHFTDGPNRHANMAESRKSKAAEYECTKCFMVIYGDELSLARHISDKSRRERRADKKEIKLPEKVRKLFESRETIEAEGQKMANEANDTLKYDQLTRDCCAKLEATLNVVFEQCKVYPFGSRISGLGNQYSDLDVFIDTGDMYKGEKNQDSLAQVQMVRKAAGTLSRYRDEFEDVYPVPTARTPIVKLYHKKTKIECDLSFRHGLSVENTKFLRCCIDIQPITQPFILLLKKWSEYNDLTEHITTYALAFMAIFYLQINQYLLPVTKIKELNPTKAMVINGWEIINYTMPVSQMKNHVVAYEHSMTRLLKDFFEFYSKFPYDNDVICPLLGYTIKKDLFDGNGDNLPPEMRSYVQQLSSKEPEQFRCYSLICIQDPFDLSHNLTKACQQVTVNKFKTLCELSHKKLEELK